LKTICAAPENLLALLQEDVQRIGKGLRWDELILNVEWRCQLTEILSDENLTEA